MRVGRHDSEPAELAAALVNVLTAGWDGGRPVAVPVGDARRAAVQAALADRPNRARDFADAGAEEHDRVVALAGRWRAVFDAAEAPEEVAALVNELLRTAPIGPVLADHDGEPWHLHAHDDDAPPAAGLAATCALGLAQVVADGATGRLGVCDAVDCDRVFVDTSRNGSRRFCSTTCQSRIKTAAFRARHA